MERLKLQSVIAKLQLALEQAPLSIIMTDRAGIIEYVNPKLAEMTGYPIEDIYGQKPGMFKSGVTVPQTLRSSGKP